MPRNKPCKPGEHLLRFIAMIPGDPSLPDMYRGRFCERCPYQDKGVLVFPGGRLIPVQP